MNRRILSMVGLCLAALVVLAGCAPAAGPVAAPTGATVPTKAPAAPTTAPAADVKKLEVFVTTPYLNPMELIRGFMVLKPEIVKQQGLDIGWTAVEMGIAPAAVQSGQAPIVSGSGIASVVTAFKGGADKIKNFIVECDQPIYDLIVAPKYKTVADLKGKVIGVPSLASASSQTSQTVLASAGLKYPGDFDLVLIGTTGGRYEALKAGKIDATSEFAPNNYKAEDDGFPILAHAKDYMPNYGTGTIILNTDWAAKNRDLLVRFTKAYIAVGQWVKDPKNKQEVIASIGSEMKISQAWSERMYNDFVVGDLLSFNGYLPKTGAVGNMQDLIRLGEYTAANVPDPGRFFDWSYVIQASKELGLTPPADY